MAAGESGPVPGGVRILEPLIGVDDLAQRLDQVSLCDIRWDLTNPGIARSAYEKGHIPGAVFVDLDRDLASAPGLRGRHPLPDIADFAETLGRLRIGPESDVVVYDDVAGRYAARLWWMLLSIGHDRVRLLDGGYQAWREAGHDIAAGRENPTPTTYPTPDGYSGVVVHDQLDGRTVIDARSPERYRGDIEPVDPKAGHIPGAVNIPTTSNLRDDGRFRAPSDLATVYSGMPEDVVVSCGSGVTACHAALAMVVAGHRLPDVYVGSFSEWSRLDLGVSTGSNP